jgi:tryptophan-rich sensory protein
LLTTFVLSVLVGDLIAIAICAVIEQFSKTASLLIFLLMFWGVIPFAWRFSVRATEPDGALMRLLANVGARKQ